MCLFLSGFPISLGSGSGGSKCSETYCGTSAISELESKALDNLLKSLGSRLKGYISDFANSEHKHKHKHKRKKSIQNQSSVTKLYVEHNVVAAMPSAFHGANNVLIIQYISIMMSFE